MPARWGRRGLVPRPAATWTLNCAGGADKAILAVGNGIAGVPAPKVAPLNRFRSFVPAELLARTESLDQDRPVSARFAGAALFADISDYTPIAELLCNQGPEGAEQLSRVLDCAFSNYVTCVHGSGGEVASFAGDALLAYWPATDGDWSSAVRRAADCASALHGASLADFRDLTRSLRLHVGLAVGPLWVARLGGVDGRWQILLAGNAVREASRAAVAARRGETLLSESAEVAVRAPLRCEQHSGRIRRIAAGPAPPGAPDDDRQPETVAGALIPGVLREWGHETHWKWLPQLRNVCALFVRIDGLDENAPDALDRYQAVMMVLQTAVPTASASGGTLIVDDKGLVFRLCLGFPHDSHADDALRAVKAGLAIEQGLRRLGLGCAAGFAAGRGLCTTLGGPERQQYVAVGRFMHLAARLMEHAGQGLLCAADVASSVRANVEWIAEQPLKLKGIADDFQPIRVRASGPRRDSRDELFGRDAETNWLTDQMGALARGQGAVIGIAGDAGIGKSALVGQLVRAATANQIDCLTGDSTSAENAVSFLAWRRVFLKLLEVNWPSIAAQSCSSKMHDVLADLAEPELAPLINSVLPGLLEENALVSGLSGHIRAQATLSLLSEVIRRSAGETFVLILEDCHWMDSASLHLVEQVVNDFPHALIILTSRLSFEGEELGTLRGLARFAELSLSPLDDGAIRAIIYNHLEDADVELKVIDDIVTRSSGNPFFALEYSLLLKSTPRNKLADLPVARRAKIDDDMLPPPVTI